MEGGAGGSDQWRWGAGNALRGSQVLQEPDGVLVAERESPPPPVCLLGGSLSPFLKDVPAHVTEETAAPEAPGVYH